MPLNTNTSATPRQELAMAIVEGEGAVNNVIGEKILPPFPINRRTAHIIKLALKDTAWGRPFDDNIYIHAPGTEFQRVTATIGDDTMTVDLRGVELLVPREAGLDYRGYLDVETMVASRFGQNSVMTKEKLIAAAVFNTTNFGSATNSAVAWTAANGTYAAFVAGTNANPIGDIIASIRRVKAKGELPDTIVMSGPVWERVRQNYSVLVFIKGIFGPMAEVTPTTFAQVLGMQEFGIKQVLIGDAYYNTAADGATPSLSQLWSNTYVWVGKAGVAAEGSMTGGVGVPTLGGVGANVFWEGYAAGGQPILTDNAAEIYAGGTYVESYPEQKTDSTVVRVKMSHKPYIGNSRGGDLIATQYS